MQLDIEDSPPQPFEIVDKEFGDLVAFFIKTLAGGRKARHPIYSIDRWANENKQGRNDPCLCGSGLKFKKCCIDT